MIKKNSPYTSFVIPSILWVVYFCYSICAALIFQKVLLQIFTGFGANGGLLPNDSMYFHGVAMDMAEQIRSQGWSAWRVFPNEHTSINTAILAVLYRLFGVDPTMMIPINAAVHAFGAVLIYKICCLLTPKKNLGVYAGVLASSLFVIFPSALNWYAQIHRDGFVIVGSLLILFSWLKILVKKDNAKNFAVATSLNFLGIVIVGMVRPYNLTLMLIVTAGIFFLLFVYFSIKGVLLSKFKVFLFYLLSLIFIFSSISYITQLRDSQFRSGNISSELLGESFYKNWNSNSNWQWTSSDWLPDSIEAKVLAAARIRAGLIEYGQNVNAKSLIDENVKPQSVSEVASYLPRALQIGVFAPFPNHWLVNMSATRLVASAEMFIFYVASIGIIFLLLLNRTLPVLVTAYFAAFFLLIYGFTLANVGSLYRVRYPYIFVLMSLGILGWVLWLDKKGLLRKIINIFKGSSGPEAPSIINDVRDARMSTIRSSVWVFALTFLGFFGFFIRDILMAKTFGLTQALDSFYVALIIPMFLVSVFLIPAGSAFIPLYLDIKKRLSLESCKNLLSSFALSVIAISVIVALGLYHFGLEIPLWFSLIKTDSISIELVNLYHLALLLFLFGGLIILGNATLNAEDRAQASTSAQLVVPIMSIFALVFFGQEYGIYAVMYGMVAGQLMNLILVQFLLRRHALSLLPSVKNIDPVHYSSFIKLYFPQVVSVLFTGLALPLATILAFSLPSGAVSAFNLGSKVVLFVTGIVTSVISVTILPYFSNLILKNHIVEVRRELSFFLLLSTLISIPISFLMYVYAQDIAELIFTGGRFDVQSAGQVVRVMQYSIVQLPFFVCSALLLKFALASKHLIAILIVAIWGLLATVVSSLFLIGHMGVAGVAFAVSISVITSTIILMLILVRYRHIVYFDALVIFLSWSLFITMLMCMHFESPPSAYSTLLAFTILTFAYLHSLKAGKRGALEPIIEK